MTQISNSSIIILETYNYRDHREDSTRTKPIVIMNTWASLEYAKWKDLFKGSAFR